MDGQRFDTWTRALGSMLSRRRLLAKAITGSTAALAVAGSAQAQEVCLSVGVANQAGCVPDACCTGWCFIESARCCAPALDPVTGQCGVDGYGCCSGYCEPHRNVCCNPIGESCQQDAECCGFVSGAAPGTTTNYCDLTTFTCQIGVVTEQPDPPAGSQPPGPDDQRVPPTGTEPDVPSLAMLVTDVSTARSSVSAVVAQLKSSLNTSDPTLSDAQLDYGTTKAAFDGWLDGFKVALVQGIDTDEVISSFEQLLRSGLQQAAQFVDTYSEMASVTGGGPSNQNPVQGPVPSDGGEVTGGGPWGAILTAVLTNLPTLVDAGKTVISEYRGAQKEQRDEILANLESLRWLPWSNIV